MDLRTILSGGRVALVKTAENWQLSLSGLMTLGTDSDSFWKVQILKGFIMKII